jgi:hypothetical protein
MRNATVDDACEFGAGHLLQLVQRLLPRKTGEGFETDSTSLAPLLGAAWSDMLGRD